MDEQELNSLLICEIENQHIDYRFGDWNNQIAWVSPLLGLGGYEIYARPFDHAHELSHIINHDNYRSGDCDTTNPNESRAHKEAILLLWDMFEKQGGDYSNFNLFIDITGCPYDFAFNIISNEFREMHEAINEIFEDEIKVSINKQEMREYIVDYISYFDVIETVSIYEFLDRYHLSHNFYEMAKKEFQQLLGTT
ncbi:Phage protein [Lactococcus lactis subsp. lactis]|uniref:Prophage protein n=2 Tax=Lactococcus lactis TaxID=1358 RepID=A0A2A5SF90_LACLH|nr:hypothetical protein [Lactococcus lactis]KAA8702384.1 hypothetical protein F4V48_07275 [Lactococcus lactis subsp. hordniae]KSU08396.1 Phage protein [Lactococcus lactis subsp. lactis]MCT3134930.1 hypothetical protein [Lactococcus lactis]PCS12085.1 prophage protein [Lactococcus lactis subsp. hordniae]